MCLLCNRYFCLSTCNEPDSIEERIKLGNAAKHSIDAHNGTAVFISPDDGIPVLYENTRTHIVKSVYADKYGHARTAEECQEPDMNKFRLNNERYIQLNSMVRDHKVIDNIISSENKEEKVYPRGYY